MKWFQIDYNFTEECLFPEIVFQVSNVGPLYFMSYVLKHSSNYFNLKSLILELNTERETN